MPEPLFRKAFERREVPAYRSMVLRAVDQARDSLFPPERGRFGRRRKSSASSVFFDTLQQLRHRGMRIARHPRADTLQKSVVPNLPTGDGLIVSLPWRLGNAGQQCLDKRIDEREQS